MRRGHWIAVDCAVAVVAALCAAAATVANLSVQHGRVFVILLVVAAVFLPTGLRRKAPVTAFGFLIVFGALATWLSVSVAGVVFLAAAYTLYTVTVEGRRRTGTLALAATLAVMIATAVAAGLTQAQKQVGGGVFIPVALASVIAWGAGYSVRQRRRYAVRLQQQAAGSAVAEERLRIARELHDVVAHSMSVIAVQAGYGQYVIDVSPDGARDALGAIQATSRDALEEMRRMLSVLRQPDSASQSARPGERTEEEGSAATDRRGSTPGSRARGGERESTAPLTPAPGLSSLDRLVERTRGAGVHVALEVSGLARPAPAGVDLSAYRIIQEALTNVVKHAGTGAVGTVSVRYTDTELGIEVTDDGGAGAAAKAVPGITAAGSGHGIIGMRERVNLCGGTFSAGPGADGGFRVTAALPLPPVRPGSPDDASDPADASGAAGAPAPAGAATRGGGRG
jgi:signal transduction histidine kinase